MIQRFRCSISCSIAHTERSRIDLRLYPGFSQRRPGTRNERGSRLTSSRSAKRAGKRCTSLLCRCLVNSVDICVKLFVGRRKERSAFWWGRIERVLITGGPEAALRLPIRYSYDPVLFRIPRARADPDSTLQDDRLPPLDLLTFLTSCTSLYPTR